VNLKLKYLTGNPVIAELQLVEANGDPVSAGLQGTFQSYLFKKKNSFKINCNGQHERD